MAVHRKHAPALHPPASCRSHDASSGASNDAAYVARGSGVQGLGMFRVETATELATSSMAASCRRSSRLIVQGGGEGFPAAMRERCCGAIRRFSALRLGCSGTRGSPDTPESQELPQRKNPCNLHKGPYQETNLSTSAQKPQTRTAWKCSCRFRGWNSSLGFIKQS